MPSHFASNGPMIIAVLWTETIIALLFVLARLYTRIRILRSPGWDDHLISISMFLFVGYSILCTIAASNGFGSHLTDLGLPQAVKAIKWEIAGQTFNIAAIATSKSSVAVFLLRIITDRTHFWVLWFCIFSTSFVCASCIVFMYTQCTPLESIFNPSLPHTCYLNFTANAIFSGSYTAAIDFALAIFPWFILWKLNMKRKERLTVALGLSLGTFAGICGIIRAVELQALAGKADYTYLTVPLILWGSTELLICILCASIPLLRPLYKHVRGIHSSNATYELGNTASRQLETGGKEFDQNTNRNFHTGSINREVDDEFVIRNTTIITGGQGDGMGSSTTTFMGGTNDDSSSKEILDGETGSFKGVEAGFDNKTTIYKKTRVDVSYQG